MASKQTKNVEFKNKDKILGRHTFQTRWSDGRGVNVLTCVSRLTPRPSQSVYRQVP